MPVEHIFQRGQGYYFRWVVPPRYHNLFGGCREIKHTLKTTDRERALLQSGQIMELIERVILSHMAKSKPAGSGGAAAFNNLIAMLANGTVLYTDAKTDKDVELFQKLLGTKAAEQPTSESLSIVADKFLAESSTIERWTPKTTQEMKATIKQLVEVVGDVPMAQLDRRSFSGFKETLLKLPANRTKNPKWRGKTAKELLSLEIVPSERMSTTTVNKLLKRLSTFLRWAMKGGYLLANPAEGQALPTKGKRDAARKPWTDAEVAALLAAPKEHQWQHWLVLLGIYTGARITELAQLRVEDVKQGEGIPCLSITDEGEGQRIKTVNSQRVVPVHPKLVEAGLLAYAETQRAAGEERLFPTITRQRDGYGKSASAWFNKWRVKAGFTNPFHSLRHTFITKLREADVSTEDIADLVGHSRGRSETARTYMKAASVERLHAAISKLSYD